MSSIAVVIFSFIGYIVAYNTYGKWLAKKIFKLSDKNITPAHSMKDDFDYVPAKKSVLFGHHFTTIAGSGPIVGPALAVIWGWVPAMLWVFFGSIFIGAVQDFSVLVISSRNRGQSTSELTKTILNGRISRIFHVIVQFYFLILISIFTMIMAILFEMYPQSVFPVWMEIPIAMLLGSLFRKGRINNLTFSLLGVLLMFATIAAGIYLPIDIPGINDSSIITWCVILFAYNFFVSVLPVHTLLQPRDYINSHEVLIMMFFLIIGIFVSNPSITAPSFHMVSDAPPVFPILFMTISCGAVSGAHSMFASGTTSKQLNRETDAVSIGYGGMLLEGFLAIIVIIVICAGLGMNGGGIEAFSSRYSSWYSAQGLASKLSAVVDGSANILSSIGIPIEFSTGIVTVFIVSFVGTTLDSSTRVQRYSLQELLPKKFAGINNKYITTLLVLGFAAVLTFAKPNGSGAMMLWPLFGSLNQLVASLSLLIVSVYLSRRNVPFWVSLLPAVFMLFVTFWSMFYDFNKFLSTGNYLNFAIAASGFVFSVFMLFSTVVFMKKDKISKRMDKAYEEE